MADIKAIKTRITSVKSTAKITKALQLVSAAKMQKAQDRSRKAELYAETLYEIVNKLGSIKDFKSPFLKQPTTEGKKHIAIVVIGTDRGFVGSMITNLELAAYDLKNDLLKKYPDANVSGVSLHKTGLRILQNVGLKDSAHFSEYKDERKQNELSSIFAYLINKFNSGEFDEIYLVYSKFITTLNQKTITKKLLPLSFEEAKEPLKKRDEKGYLFEPGQEEILNWILPEYFQTTIYSALLSSIASEYSSRMVSMKKATDNANDLTQQLTLQYNKTRQAEITQEIIEIVGGAETGKVVN